MDINEIKLKWGLSETNKESNIKLWDVKAEHFGNYTISNFQDDKFLKLLKDENLLKKDFKVLDVGCGGGKYTLALSKECGEVCGIDLSPKMIDYAKNNKDKYEAKNTYFICDDWHEINIKKLNLYKNFDLVFASMTPAIQSVSTLEKLIEASRKYCVLRCNIRRKDLIYDKIRKLLNMEYKEENLNFLYAFNLLYLKGYTPKIYYEEKSWSYKESIEKSYEIYIEKIKSIKNINNKEENAIKIFLNHMSRDGYVEEEINSTVATLIWNVE